MARAGHAEAELVGEMRVKRVALHAGLVRDHAEGRRRRTKLCVQLDCGFDQPIPGFCLLRRALFEGIGPRHIFIAR